MAKNREHRSKRQSVLGGSLLLMASAAAAKLFGAVFRIPLTAMLGGEGMGYFSSAYGLFLPIFSLSVTGMNTAVAALTARLLAQNRDSAVWALCRKSLHLFALIGVCGSLLLFLAAKPLCIFFLHNSGAVLSVQCFAPAVFFCCINAVLRGVWEGRQDMRPTAFSQCLESAARLGFGLLLCRFVLTHTDILPPTPYSLSQIAAAAAIFGVTLSTAAGTLLLCLFRQPKCPKPSELTDSRPLMRSLWRLLLPISAAALVTNLTSIVDLVTGMRGLEQMISRAPAAFSRFASAEQAANYLYGAFSGMSVTIFNLVPSLTNMLGKGVLPAFAASFSADDPRAMSAHAASALQTSALLAIPSGLGIFALSAPILTLLFPSRPTEIAAAAPPLMVLGLAVIPLALSIPLMSMLQAANAAGQSAMTTLWGACTKLLCNLLLIPRLGLMGMAVSTLICYVVILVRAAVIFRRKTGLSASLPAVCRKPAVSGIACAVAAASAYPLLMRVFPQAASLLCAVAVGGGVYLLCLWCLRVQLRPAA